MTFVRNPPAIVKCRCGWEEIVWPPSDQLALWLRDIHRVRCPLKRDQNQENAA
jgi:hypothetical protein